MIRLALIFGLVVAALLGATAAADPQDDTKNADAATIPLDQIWAWWMPGTQPMQTSSKPGQPRPPEAPFLNDIRRALGNRPVEGTAPRSGFAVLGKELDAIKEAHAVLVDGKEPRDSFCASDEISVVFFSYQAGVYVHLNQIERRGNVVQVQYNMIPHRTREATEHFALIPLGRLPVGTFRVEFDQTPLTKAVADIYRVPPTRPELAHQIICGAFSFDVEKCNTDKGS